VSRRVLLSLLGVAGVVLVMAIAAYAVGVKHGWGPRPVGTGGPPDVPPPPSTDGIRTSAPPCVSSVDGWDHTWLPAAFRVSVDPDPQSVAAVWWPTLGDEACRLSKTTGDKAVAVALARDIRQAPEIKPGIYHCPMDVGGAVDLYFAYGRNRWERVRVYPTGCGKITAPGRKPRRAMFGRDLGSIAPPGEWQQMLR
jgi:hypothetical protein